MYSILYYLGYTKNDIDIEISDKIKQQRHLLMKQIKNSNLKLNKIYHNDNSNVVISEINKKFKKKKSKKNKQQHTYFSK